MTTICAQCGIHACKSRGEYPSSCASRLESVAEATEFYADPETQVMAEASGRTDSIE